MESYRLKNIILLLLVVTNLFLLATLLFRWVDEARLQESAATELVQLFSSRGVELDAKTISQEIPSSLLTLTRSSQEEEKLAAFFLGEDVSFQDDGRRVNSLSKRSGHSKFPQQRRLYPPLPPSLPMIHRNCATTFSGSSTIRRPPSLWRRTQEPSPPRNTLTAVRWSIVP